MAQQLVNIGTVANDGTGDPLRTAFDKINDNFTELYSDENTGEVNSITAGEGLSGNAIVGAVILDVNVDDSTIEVASDNIQVKDLGIATGKIANDAVTFAKLENRYTALSALGSGSSFSIDFSAATTFTATASANATLTMSNAVQGQVVDIILSGNFTITLAETGSTFNKVGTLSYDGTTTNIIQIICTDDSSGSKIYHYAVAPYTSSTSV
jgi:hypothetical protein